MPAALPSFGCSGSRALHAEGWWCRNGASDAEPTAVMKHCPLSPRAWKRAGTSVATVALFCLWTSAGSADGTQSLPPVSSVSGSPRLPGKFVWADLVTDDVPAARRFYGRLFGWTFRDIGGYVVAANDERPLCGMFQRSRPADRPDARPRWFGHISVGNVEKTQRTVTKAGGRVLVAPQKFPGRGEQAIFADSEGALFGAIKSSSGDPPDFLPEPGDW